MQAEQTLPIYGFTEPAAYLRGLYDAGKRSPSSVNLRQLAARSGFRSPATLSMIFNQKRNLTVESAERIGRAFGLSSETMKYLVALTKFRTLRSTVEKDRALEELGRLQQAYVRKPKLLQQNRFLATWYYPAILVMTETKGFRSEANWIAQRLGRGVTPQEVKAAIGDLLNLKLLRQEGKKLVKSDGLLTTKDELHDLAIQSYHQQMLLLAVDSLKAPGDRREMNGLTIAVRRNQLPELKEKIREFRKELNRFLSTGQREADEVIQINVNFFTLTQPASPGDEA